MMAAAPIETVQLAGTGVTVGISNPPATEIRVVMDEGGVEYCAVLTGASLVAIEGLGAEEPPTETVPDDPMRKWISDRASRAARTEVEQTGDWLRARIAAGREGTDHAELESRISRQLADRKKGLTARQAEDFVRSNMRPSDEGWVWKFDPLARWQASHEVVKSQVPFWSAITGPVLHIYGSESWAFPPEVSKLNAFSDGLLTVIKGAGHWVHLNEPEQVSNAIYRFFKCQTREALGDQEARRPAS